MASSTLWHLIILIKNRYLYRNYLLHFTFFVRYALYSIVHFMAPHHLWHRKVYARRTLYVRYTLRGLVQSMASHYLNKKSLSIRKLTIYDIVYSKYVVHSMASCTLWQLTIYGIVNSMTSYTLWHRNSMSIFRSMAS